MTKLTARLTKLEKAAAALRPTTTPKYRAMRDAHDFGLYHLAPYAPGEPLNWPKFSAQFNAAYGYPADHADLLTVTQAEYERMSAAGLIGGLTIEWIDYNDLARYESGAE